ncbi:peroxiredoxin [Granulicella aggregans]|uniref:Peroxiredoxin n=1 Tax=Granulicella aggregans TaxID=474949 RepID=A0A7W7ZDT9_9BACT|nr:TlpA disulfide reductase family protein [Granulicella aggregans]MBB5058028.1 peroxiredoxin [Granulicella aggregans]
MRSEFTKPVITGRLWVAACGLAVVIASVTPALYGQQDKHASLTAPESRRPAPAFELISEDGKKMHLADYRGKVVLLNFWATDCGGCVLEIPSFIEFQKNYREKGFVAVGVAMDISYDGLKNANEAWAKVRPFMATKGINYRIAMGDDAISKTYALNAYPATYLIDKSGRVAVAYVGVVVDKDNVETNIKGLLSER